MDVIWTKVDLMHQHSVAEWLSAPEDDSDCDKPEADCSEEEAGKHDAAENIDHDVPGPVQEEVCCPSQARRSHYTCQASKELLKPLSVSLVIKPVAVVLRP